MIHILHISQHPSLHFSEILQRLESEVHNTLWNNQASLEEQQIIHAHSWLDDGPIALELSEKLGIPFIISFAPDEISHIKKLSLTLHPQWVAILKQATKIILPHPDFAHQLEQALSDSLADIIFRKTLTIYQPIDPYFLQHLHLHKPVALVHTRLLYVAQDPHYKADMEFILKAVKKIQHQHLDIQLSVANVGNDPEVRHTAAKLNLSVMDAEDIATRAEIYRAHDIVAMTGTHLRSTQYFAEAISQGLPVIYSKHSCLDGVMPDGGICMLEKEDSSHLSEKIMEISQRFATIEQHLSSLHPLNRFNADEIYREYLRIYSISHSLHNRDSRI